MKASDSILKESSPTTSRKNSLLQVPSRILNRAKSLVSDSKSSEDEMAESKDTTMVSIIYIITYLLLWDIINENHTGAHLSRINLGLCVCLPPATYVARYSTPTPILID